MYVLGLGLPQSCALCPRIGSRHATRLSRLCEFAATVLRAMLARVLRRLLALLLFFESNGVIAIPTARDDGVVITISAPLENATYTRRLDLNISLQITPTAEIAADGRLVKSGADVAQFPELYELCVLDTSYDPLPACYVLLDATRFVPFMLLPGEHVLSFGVRSIEHTRHFPRPSSWLGFKEVHFRIVDPEWSQSGYNSAFEDPCDSWNAGVVAACQEVRARWTSSLTPTSRGSKGFTLPALTLRRTSNSHVPPFASPSGNAIICVEKADRHG